MENRGENPRDTNLCFLDMDGVLLDFLGSASRAHGRPLPYSDPKWKGVWETEKAWGISEEEFWEPINKLGVGFWANLQKTPEADRIVALAQEKYGENVAILTAPSDNPGCYEGKRETIHKEWPWLDKRIIFAASGTKKFLSGPGRTLVDDRDRNIEQWEEAGGRGILVPRDWNSAHPLTKLTFEEVKRGFKSWPLNDKNRNY